MAIPTRAELLDRAEAVAAAVAPYADEAERLRRMPPQVVEAFEASGLMPLVRPARYGGYEQDWTTFADCLMPMGRVSGSITWCFAFLIGHQWALSHWPIPLQDAIYTQDPNPKVASSFAPSGRATKVDGGYRISGEWPFASGSDHCDWAIVGAMLMEEAKPPTMLWVLFKPGQFTVRDVWQSTGLKGSGSNNIVVDDVFVEEAYAFEAMQALMGTHPGRGISDQPIYSTGFGSQFQFGLLPPLLAVSFGLFEDFVAFTRDKNSVLGAGRKIDSPTVQLRVGEAAAELNAAHLILRAQNDRVMAGAIPGPEAQAAFLRDVGMVARLALSASDRLFTLSGARGLDEGNLFGRHWRDVHAMCNHVALQGDPMLQAYGAAVLGGVAAGVGR